MKRVILTLSSAVFLLLFASIVHAQAAQLTITFTDNSANETGFELERCQGVGCTAFGLVTTLGANVTSYIDTAVSEGVTYCYRARAKNTAGFSTYSNTGCGTPPATIPLAPSNLVVK